MISLAAAFLIVALILFVLAAFGFDGRLIPAGLAFAVASALVGLV